MINSLDQDDTFTTFEAKVNRLVNESHLREIRSCNLGCIPCPNDTGLLSSPAATSLFIIMIVLLILLALGLIKGLFGIYCCPPVGMCGLGALIDLPRPMRHYQEEELANFPVQYDFIGWPVHPQTKKRTVRAISIRSEFCLNVIFFITYPLVMALTFLTSVCLQQVYDNEEADDKIFKKDHTVMLTECPSIMCKRKASEELEIALAPSSMGQQIYADESGTEEMDTRYVFEQLRASEEHLRRSN